MTQEAREAAKSRVIAYLEEIERVRLANRTGSTYGDAVHAINDFDLRLSDIRLLVSE